VPQLTPLAKQAMDVPTKLNSRLPSALQSIEEFGEFIQAVGSSIQLKLLLQSLIDMLGVIVVNVLDLILSQGPQAHVQDEAGMLSKAYVLIVVPALDCRLCPVTLDKA